MHQIVSKKSGTIARFAAAVVFAVAASATMTSAQTPPGKQDQPSPLPLPHGLLPDGKKADPAPQTSPPGTADAVKKPPQLGRVIPDSPGERAKLLDDLYAHLATAPDEATAKPFSDTIERVWLTSGSDTVSVLMERAMKSVGHKRSDLALQLLSAVVDLAPDYAEGWNRRAYVFYTEGDYERALGDLRRVLALDPNHYKALDGLGQIMKQLGRKPQALQAYEKLLAVNPFWPNVQTIVDELKRDVDGRGI